jgi:hypothetical protein
MKLNGDCNDNFLFSIFLIHDTATRAIFYFLVFLYSFN